MRISTGTPANNFDPMVGLYNYGFRDYNPQRGAWTTQDPIRAGANWYAYVNEDPANLVDPLGLSASAGSKADISAAGLGLTKVPHVAPSTPTFPGVQVVWNPAESKPPVAGSSVQSFEEWQNSEIERSSGEPSDTLPPQSEDFTLSIMPPLMPLARSPAESAAPAAGNVAKTGEHTVYALRDPITGQVKYVGRTIDPADREAAHAASTDKAGLRFTPLKEGLTYPEARGWEQKLFEQNGGFDKLLNKINPISPKNPNLPTYLQAAQ